MRIGLRMKGKTTGPLVWYPIRRIHPAGDSGTFRNVELMNGEVHMIAVETLQHYDSNWRALEVRKRGIPA